ncbi:hypothetical protein Q428_07420 [Fervidicella metallireducens AeB]|uniref:Uncharacterized protein n=1 Tax=Fervidicella metallireducens AeB TaxID=1403537 RepID=A0A017RUR4_9CLOT|nr:hypothetical protein Q428_07420 [Fervidicella metallireducens AeB]
MGGESGEVRVIDLKVKRKQKKYKKLYNIFESFLNFFRGSRHKCLKKKNGIKKPVNH